VGRADPAGTRPNGEITPDMSVPATSREGGTDQGGDKGMIAEQDSPFRYGLDPVDVFPRKRTGLGSVGGFFSGPET